MLKARTRSLRRFYPLKKGYLYINKHEQAAVQFAFKKYLECGSLIETARRLNTSGHRTKGYTSRRNKVQVPKNYGRSSIRCVLINLAYVGKKEINKKWRTQDQEKLPENQRYHVVPAVWEPLVDENTLHIPIQRERSFQSSVNTYSNLA